MKWRSNTIAAGLGTEQAAAVHRRRHRLPSPPTTHAIPTCRQTCLHPLSLPLPAASMLENAQKCGELV